jgi:hypothetical protein
LGPQVLGPERYKYQPREIGSHGEGGGTVLYSTRAWRDKNERAKVHVSFEQSDLILIEFILYRDAGKVQEEGGMREEEGTKWGGGGEVRREEGGGGKG